MQQQRWVFDLDEGVDVLQPGLHQGEARLDGVISKGNRLAHRLVVCAHAGRDIGRGLVSEATGRPSDGNISRELPRRTGGDKGAGE